jgi:hypothetical protein
MEEKTETDFAFHLATVIGMLYNPEIQDYLKENGVPEVEITAAGLILKEMAKKCFYRQDKKEKPYVHWVRRRVAKKQKRGRKKC